MFESTHQQLLLELKPEVLIATIDQHDEDKKGVPKGAFSSYLLDRIVNATVCVDRKS